jgi:hypothetical protein
MIASRANAPMASGSHVHLRGHFNFCGRFCFTADPAVSRGFDATAVCCEVTFAALLLLRAYTLNVAEL